MSKFNSFTSTPGDLLNPLGGQADFKERATRFAVDETRAFSWCSQLRARIRNLEDTLEQHTEAAKLLKTDGLRDQRNIAVIKERLDRARDEYREGVRSLSQFVAKLERLEQMAEREFGSVPYYRSIA